MTKTKPVDDAESIDVLFFTRNKRAFQSLKHAFHKATVVKLESMSALTEMIKTGSADAIVVHIRDQDAWTVLELLNTGYSQIPRFAVVPTKVIEADHDFDAYTYANHYGASAIVDENNLDQLATLIENTRHVPQNSAFDSKSEFMSIFGEMQRHVQRLQSELNVTALRTLPQKEIARDTRDRMSQLLERLKAIEIKP